MATAASTSSSAKSYPFSSDAIILPEPFKTAPAGLRAGKGLMAHLLKTLPSPEKQTLLRKLFSKQSPERLYAGSVLTVTMEHAPGTFTGVLLAIRRRGPDSSFVLRNVIQRTGVEMQIFPNSPHIKDIKVVQKPPGGRMKRAKLFYLRDSPDKMSAIAGGGGGNKKRK